VAIRTAAWLSTGVFAIAACTSGGTPSARVTPSFGAYVSGNIACDRPGPTPPAGPVATRSPITPYGGYGGGFGGIAVDGNGIAWTAGPRTVVCYGAFHRFTSFKVQDGTQISMFRTAPDGSVWFADSALGRLGRIGRDGVLTERQVAGGLNHPSALAIGPDGSVWFDVSSPPENGVARLRPDGRLTTYPVWSGPFITVDSHGNAWIPALSGREIDLISDKGDIHRFSVAVFNTPLTEAADGRMWFLNVGCLPVQQIGWIDVNGQTRFFDADIVDNSTLPNGIARGPDGALWFGTVDGRLIRIASETDVTIYSLPWPDARVGPFVVLPHNHILMVGFKELVYGSGDTELLDFTAVNGTRLAGVQAVPGPRPQYVKDAAEAAAYPVVAKASGPNAKIVLQQSFEGDHAALFEYWVDQGRCGGPGQFVYVVEDPGGWRLYEAIQVPPYILPEPRRVIALKFQTGCLNVHESPSLGSRILTCVASGTTVDVDNKLPVYADGYIWWYVILHRFQDTGQYADQYRPLGWAVQKYLLCIDYQIGRLPQC
jgi:streptogramin lyase